jgi:hypothetical protein
LSYTSPINLENSLVNYEEVDEEEEERDWVPGFTRQVARKVFADKVLSSSLPSV